MSIVFEGVYTQVGQADTVLPVKVDSTGRLETTTTAVVSSEVEIKNDAGNPLPVNAVTRLSVGKQTLAVTNSVVSSLTAPVGAVAAIIQADGGAVSASFDATSPTASNGLRLDDGAIFYADTALADVRLIARAATTNVQVIYFNKA